MHKNNDFRNFFPERLEVLLDIIRRKVVNFLFDWGCIFACTCLLDSKDGNLAISMFGYLNLLKYFKILTMV